MGRAMARLGDKCYGVCTSHTTPITVEGLIISASETFKMNGRGVARLGDKVRSNCGHEGIIYTGDETTYIDGRPHARLGDKFKGEYTGEIISVSEDGF